MSASMPQMWVQAKLKEKLLKVIRMSLYMGICRIKIVSAKLSTDIFKDGVSPYAVRSNSKQLMPFSLVNENCIGVKGGHTENM
jgi:hypothetical protein